MKHLILYTSLFLSVCTVSSLPAVAGDGNSFPWMEETSIPPWAEAQMKSRLAPEWTPAGEAIDRSLAFEYDVLFYGLDLRFPMTNDSLSGTALIRCRSEKDSLGSVYLHLDGLTSTLCWSTELMRMTGAMREVGYT
jgi:hypothetical protein